MGGWVPFLLIEEHRREGDSFRHVGSIDIDIVVDPEEVGEEEYRTIVRSIEEVGWRGRPGSRFSFERAVPCPDGVARDISVDFLTVASGGPGGSHRHRIVQPDLSARTMRGAELAMTHRALRTLSGRLPGGADAESEILMLDVVGCLGTKSFALGERFKHKDACDIVPILDHFGSGPDEVASLVRPSAREPKMAAALSSLDRQFRWDRSEGPSWYAEFVGGDPDVQARSRQRAYQLVREFLRSLA